MVLTDEDSVGKKGIQYFGVQVEDWEGTSARFRDLGINLSPPRNPDGEVRMRDPEGNLFVLSQKGWGS